MKRDLKELYTKDKPGLTKSIVTLKGLCKHNDWCKIESRVLSINDEHISAITQMVVLGIDPVKIINNLDSLVSLTVLTSKDIGFICTISVVVLNNFKS